MATPPPIDAEARWRGGLPADHLVLGPRERPRSATAQLYGANDLERLLGMRLEAPASRAAYALDELLERDRRREQDGFPRKIRLSKLIRPGKGGKEKIVIVPTAEEEKLYHDTRQQDERQDQSGGDGGPSGGTGDADEGQVIGEEPIHQPAGQGSGGVGGGQGGDHEVGSDVYELGRIITERFQLPNLKEKGKRRSLTRYGYDLTSRHRGEGQVLDKGATLKQILKTNIALGIVQQGQPIDPTKLLVHPHDRIYRVLSRELDYDSQAVVFFLRDYSGSMQGPPTDLVVAQHVILYSCLVYQYEHRVTSRFIVHDTDAKEVPDFYTYSHATVAGGTRVASAIRLVNQLVADEQLARDNNIYVFYGGDGDDWDGDGEECLAGLEAMTAYANRIGLTIVRAPGSVTAFERYLGTSGILTRHRREMRLVHLAPPAAEDAIIESIRTLTVPA